MRSNEATSLAFRSARGQSGVIVARSAFVRCHRRQDDRDLDEAVAGGECPLTRAIGSILKR